jgi:hypothetical protein
MQHAACEEKAKRSRGNLRASRAVIGKSLLVIDLKYSSERIRIHIWSDGRPPEK